MKILTILGVISNWCISNLLLGKEKTNTQITNNKYTNTQTYQSTNLYGDGKASEKIVREL